MQRTVRSHHAGPAFARGEQRQSRYRGYDIKMERRDLCWMVMMKPYASDLPEFRRYAFQTATQSEREALAQAKQRVDDALTLDGMKANAALR